MPAGRPRAFDADKALDVALGVFWRNGYEGTSLPDLTKAMGINKPSLYAAFGNKESLFRKAVQRYTEGPASHLLEAIEKPTAREVVEAVFCGTITLVTGAKNPHGCMLVQSALACGAEAAPVRREAARRRAGGEATLRKRFDRAILEGDLPKNADAADLARFVTTVTHGMAVQASGGATRADLHKVATMALRAFPK